MATIIRIQLFKLKSNGVKINSETIVEVWKDYVHIHYNNTLAAVTKAGYRAILAAPWYLNRVTYGHGLKYNFNISRRFCVGLTWLRVGFFQVQIKS